MAKFYKYDGTVVEREPGPHPLLVEIEDAHNMLNAANIGVERQTDLIRDNRQTRGREVEEAKAERMQQARQTVLDQARAQLDRFLPALSKELGDLQSRRAALLEESELAWREKFGAGLAGAFEEAKATVNGLEHLRDFEAVYSGSTAPMKRAFQVVAGEVLRSRFAGDMNLGSVLVGLARDRDTFFATDQIRALSEALSPLVQTTRALNTFSRELKRSREGLAGIVGAVN
jgi:hypothetical protein